MTKRITLAQLREMQKKAQDKRRVRGAVRTMIGDESFDSKHEARRWQDLLLLERAGDIRDLKRQVPIPLYGKDAPLLTPTGRQMMSVVDFSYFDCRLGAPVLEDPKGHQTEVSKIKFAILAAQGMGVTLV